MSPARVAGRVSRVVSGETVTHAMERTPSSVALTAEALRLLDDPRDETRETKMSMLEHDMWNPFRTDQMDALDDARDRMSVHEEDDAAGGKRQSRVSGNSAFDAVGGSFVAYLAPRFGPSSSSRPAKLLMRTLAQELDCAASRDVGSRGSVALESSGVQLHDRDDVAVLFVGELENKAELAENLPGPNPAHRITCAELIHRLYQDSGPAFVSELVGFFSFVVVDADAAVVLAAVDRHASFPLVKGRCAGGGVFIAHAAGSNGARALRHNLGEATRVPAGSYLHGNRHMHPHRYARCAEAERCAGGDGRRVGAAAARLRRGIGRHAGRIRPGTFAIALSQISQGRVTRRTSLERVGKSRRSTRGFRRRRRAKRVAVGVGSLRGEPIATGFRAARVRLRHERSAFVGRGGSTSTRRGRRR